MREAPSTVLAGQGGRPATGDVVTLLTQRTRTAAPIAAIRRARCLHLRAMFRWAPMGTMVPSKRCGLVTRGPKAPHLVC